jgi:energy-coupling factor transport system ATP-binding protein
MENIIEAKNIVFRYSSEEEPTLKGVSLSIKPGEMVAILGHNGSGKSTLAKHINAVLIPESGSCVVDGIDTSQIDMAYSIRSRVGMVFQNPDNQIVATVVEEDVAFGLENIGVESSEMRVRVDEALKDVDMYEYREHAPHQLSGGQKQRVAIAGIIAMRPKIIVLDEPTAMLDPRGRREVMDTILELNRTFGITVILITHHMDEAARCSRVVVMDEGRILFDAAPKEVFSNVSQLKSVGLDVPQATEIIYALRCEGYDLPKDIITDDECVEVLSSWIGQVQKERQWKQ